MNKSKRRPAIPAGSRFVLFIWRDAAAIRMLLFAPGIVVLRRGGQRGLRGFFFRRSSIAAARITGNIMAASMPALRLSPKSPDT